MGRILAVDPGEVRIGLAISDPTQTIARPLKVLRHVSRKQDAEAIASVACEYEVEYILVGLALDDEGNVGPQARRALRLVDVLGSVTELPVETWDESGSSKEARQGHKKDSMLDARAAAVILQEHLNVQAEKT